MSQLNKQTAEWEGEIPSSANYTAPPPPPPSPSSYDRDSSPPPNSPSPSTPPPPPSPIASPPPRRRPSSPPREYANGAEWSYDPEGVGKKRKDSFGILELPMTATEREIKVQYRRLARTYHPDKYALASNEVSSRMTVLEAQQHFQMLGNAYDYVRNQ